MKHSYEVNGKKITFSPHLFEGRKSYQKYAEEIYTALNKIGVTRKYILIENLDEGVRVSWKINESSFSFECHSQDDSRLNIGAIAQAIQEDVRQIQRGIKDLNLVMRQYGSWELGENNSKNRQGLLEYGEGYEKEFVPGSQESFPTTFSSTLEARETIAKIKEKYSNFTDLSLLPEEDKKSLRQAYMYLGIIVKF